MNIDLIKKYITPLKPIPTQLKPRGKLERQIKCILFDVYGTLFISGSGDIGVTMSQLEKSPALNYLLDEFEIDISPDNLLQQFFQSISDVHQEMKKKGIDYPEVNIDKIWMKVLDNNHLMRVREFATQFEMLVNPVYPMPNLSKILKVCKDKNMHMGIISNAQFYTPILFKLFLGAEPEYLGFNEELIVYSYQFDHAKPSPLLFKTVLHKLQKFKISTDQVLYLGNDMLNDIYPAHMTGFKTALFAGDSRSLRLRNNDKRCKNLTPDIIITELVQLIEYI